MPILFLSLSKVMNDKADQVSIGVIIMEIGTQIF